MIIVAHGGAGWGKPQKKPLKTLEKSLRAGYAILENGGSALDAVMETIAIMEDSGQFNAGAGGNLQLDGIRRLDAALMDGRSLNCGSVIGLEGIRNPIKAARAVMKLPHKILTNIGARRLAEAAELEPLAKPDEKALKRLEKFKKKGVDLTKFYEDYFSTVGAVALDKSGCVAAGSSTGGVALMLPGRVGDTPLIGSGIYAENSSGAVSCTGRGEDIIRMALAKEICMRMQDNPPEKAAKDSFKNLFKIEGQAGIISVNPKGKIAIIHTTGFMASGFADRKGVVVKDGFKRFAK